MITRSRTYDKMSSNHTDNGADMPHSMTALTINKQQTNQSPVIERPHCTSRTPQERPTFMLATNGEGDQLSSDVNSDTDLNEDDLSETDDDGEWCDLATTLV